MKPIDVALNRLAARQYSLAHRQQALDLGMTARQIQARVEAGWLVPVHRGVYRLAGGPDSTEQSLLAACLAVGARSAALHRSTGVLWGLRGVHASPVEITVAERGYTRLAGVVTGIPAHRDTSMRSRVSVR